ncbi:centrosomal protein of 55 kDa isoform X2 [Brienomyrus brachyistius]|uniref:centrosomal protein of 55 kDa isoform X2 n=1 Tax=Brienomyrus brachyistius TaxID=42636 RepID=UPI0020B2D66E|nr:centrosomal protein of 55 kDa isoform X2 [Brienomyrus brachyistius]
MASKQAKDSIVSKLGMKLGGSKSEMELDKLRKENAHLKRTIHEFSNRNGKLTDSEKSKLLERILSLETLQQQNMSQLLTKEQEVASLRQQLAATGRGAEASVRAQLDQKSREAEKWEKLYQGLSEETENLKSKWIAVYARCQQLESTPANGNPGLQSSSAEGQVVSSDVAVVQEHLKDALEKNQQWLVYDQQREAYVKAVLARAFELEQQLKQANHALQEQNKEGDSGDIKLAQKQEYYDNLLLTARKDLEAQKEQVVQAQGELANLRARLEDKGKETAEQLRAERARGQEGADEARRLAEQRADVLKAELENVRARLEEEKQRSTELICQVNMLQKSLLNQHEEQKRIALLEQQIQASTRDFENEKLDRQTLQKQLHKVLKELRKARDQITRLESAQRGSHFPDLEFEKLSVEDPAQNRSSLSRIPNLLDESFLECPKCHAAYPTSQHRELLAHIDYCFS